MGPPCGDTTRIAATWPCWLAAGRGASFRRPVPAADTHQLAVDLYYAAMSARRSRRPDWRLHQARILSDSLTAAFAGGLASAPIAAAAAARLTTAPGIEIPALNQPEPSKCQIDVSVAPRDNTVGWLAGDDAVEPLRREFARPQRVEYRRNAFSRLGVGLQKPFWFVSWGSPMKVLLGALIAVAGALPAFAFSVVPNSVPRPAPAPDLGVGVSAVFAVIAAYMIARLVVRQMRAGLPDES
jgi:hypothetical protein